VTAGRRPRGRSLCDVSPSGEVSRNWRAQLATPAIDLRIAAIIWLLTWFGGQLLGAIVFSVFPTSADELRSIGVLALALIASWTAYGAGLWWASLTVGAQNLRKDYRWSWSWSDLGAVPIGVATQIVVIPGVYWPLQQVWPEVFLSEKLEENARRLVESAAGLSIVGLALLVVVGAPLIEEFVYRGLLQRSIATQVSPLLALLLGSAWFALIHFRPVEYPGLFIAGLVFGGCLMVTGRLGTAITAHAAFNLAGLAQVWVA
jgi:membrane protease YdiL (CAAX protease family)